MKLLTLFVGIFVFSLNSFSQELAFTQWGDTLVAYENGTWRNLRDVLIKVKSVNTTALDSEYGASINITLESGETRELFSGKYTSELIVLDKSGKPISDYFIDGEVNEKYSKQILYLSYILWASNDIEVIKMHL